MGMVEEIGDKGYQGSSMMRFDFGDKPDELGWVPLDIVIPGVGTITLEYNSETVSVNEYRFTPAGALPHTCRNHWDARV